MRAIEKPVQDQVKSHFARKIPFFDGSVNAGFPSPAQDYHEEEISAEELLGLTPTCYLNKVNGPSMEGAHIPHGAVLVVDRARKPSSGDVVVALLNNEFVIKRFVKTPAGLVLHPENANYQPYLIKGDDQFQVWGVVKKVVISL
ncbi:translesion error-prone DNA polymerase V autoproteolytic subunit [Chitinophaga sp. YIM B06452]|uniref:LexA family protein n=1 Tax=Chitinophaga sp. YIM B06452 TaxID=3082158 RepID=UPI0031FF1D2B